MFKSKKKKKAGPGTPVSVQQSLEQKYIFPHMTTNKCLRKAQALSSQTINTLLPQTKVSN